MAQRDTVLVRFHDFEYIWEQLKCSGGLVPAVSLQDIFSADMQVLTPPHSGEVRNPYNLILF